MVVIPAALKDPLIPNWPRVNSKTLRRKSKHRKTKQKPGGPTVPATVEDQLSPGFEDQPGQQRKILYPVAKRGQRQKDGVPGSLHTQEDPVSKKLIIGAYLT